MLAFPGVRGVKGSVRRVRVLVSRRDTAVQKLRLRLRPVRLRLFRLHPVRTEAGLRHDKHTGFLGLSTVFTMISLVVSSASISGDRASILRLLTSVSVIDLCRSAARLKTLGSMSVQF